MDQSDLAMLGLLAKPVPLGYPLLCLKLSFPAAQGHRDRGGPSAPCCIPHLYGQARGTFP